MEDTGVSMEYATSGLSAIQMVQALHEKDNDYNPVLLDWKMPEMDSIKAARRIRQILPLVTSIMMLSTYDWSEIEEEAIAAGIDGFMPKPFFLSNFKQAIEKLKLRRDSSADADSAQSILDSKHVLSAEDNELNSEILTELLEMAVKDVLSRKKKQASSH